ncbi:MAG: ABC transporter substrate-binding protein [Chloroflexota bacterium]
MGKRLLAKVNLIIIGLLVLAIAAGCAAPPATQQPAAAGNDKPAEMTNVSIRWSDRLTPQGILFKGGNYAEKYGLDVQYVMFPSGTEIRDALVSGDLDIGEVGITPALTGLVRAQDSIQIIGVSSFGGGKYSVVVGKDSSYQNMKDLVGKKIAVKVGSGCYTAFMLWAQGQGLDAEKDFQVLDMGDVDAMAALETKSVDAVVYWEPIPSLLIAKGLAREIFNFKGLVNNPVFLMVRTEFAEKNPEAVARFLAAWADMDQMMVFNVPQAAEISSKGLSGQGIEVPPDAYALALGKETYEIWLYPELIKETTGLFQSLQDADKIPKDAKLDWTKIYRPEYASRAHEILVEKALSN